LNKNLSGVPVLSGTVLSERITPNPELLFCMLQNLFFKPLLLGLVPSLVIWACTINVVIESLYRG
jgi:hypothetical protein